MADLEISDLAKIFFSIVLTDSTVRTKLRHEQLSGGEHEAKDLELQDPGRAERFITIVNEALGDIGRLQRHDVDRFIEALLDLARKAETIDDRPIASENVVQYFGITITSLINLGHGG